MHRSLLVAPLFLLIACGADAPVQKAAEPAKAAEPVGDRSTAFTVVVTVDDKAGALLAKRKEGIIVDVTFSDPNAGGDDQGYRRQEVELSGAGGEAQIGPIDLSPAKAGGGRLTQMSVNVYSARKSGEDNLLNCSFADGEAGKLKASYAVSCTLI